MPLISKRQTSITLAEEARAWYIPEKEEGYVRSSGYPTEPADFFTIERETKRKESITSMKRALDISDEHQRDIHKRCGCKRQKSGGGGSQQYYKCPAQQVAIAAYHERVKGQLEFLLSPVGMLHIQHCENTNSTLSSMRAKGIPMMPASNFLAEAMALMQQAELQLAENGVDCGHWQERIAAYIQRHMEVIYIPPSGKNLDRRLGRRVAQKRHRQSGEYKEKEKKARIERRSGSGKAKKEGRDGDYESQSKAVARSATGFMFPLEAEAGKAAGGSEAGGGGADGRGGRSSGGKMVD